MADIDDILKPQGSDYNFNILRDTTLGGLLTKFLMNQFGNNQAMDSGGRTYRQAMLQDDRSGREPITGADGYKYWSDSGERVFPNIMKDEQRRMIQAADGYYYYQDSGERVLPNVMKSEDGGRRNTLDELNISKAEIEMILQSRQSYQSKQAKDIQNLWKGLK